MLERLFEFFCIGVAIIVIIPIVISWLGVIIAFLAELLKVVLAVGAVAAIGWLITECFALAST